MMMGNMLGAVTRNILEIRVILGPLGKWKCIACVGIAVATASDMLYIANPAGKDDLL